MDTAEAIDLLDQQDRDVINALFWERISLREAADRFGISHMQASRVRDRAQARLAELMGGDQD